MQPDNTLNEIFNKLTGELVKNKIAFSIAGAFAVSLYTQPRATSDIDLVTFLDDKKQGKIIDILERNFKLVQSNPEKIPMRFYEIWRHIIKSENTSTMVVPIDIISVPEDYLASVLKKSVVLQVNDLDLKFMAKEDLILMKLNSTRAKDVDDIERMVKGKGKIDFAYINLWAKKFSLHAEILKKIKKDLHMDLGTEQ